MAHIERRRIQRRDSSGRLRAVTRYRVRYRDESGMQHCETKMRLVDAERRKAEIEVALAGGTWRDPRRGDMRLHEWVEQWLPTRHDLRATTWARLETTMQKQVLPRFGDAPLRAITNSGIRQWVSDLLTSGLSAATTRKAVFALRQCLAAAIADNRLQFNPATAIPLPTERQKPARYLSQLEVERLVDEMPRQYRALVLVGAYAGLRWGEAAGLRRRDIDPLRSRIRVTSTAVELRGRVTLDNEPKTTRSKRSVPIARSVMRRLEQHLSEFVDPTFDALVFTAPGGGPLFRAWGAHRLASGGVARRIGRHHLPRTSPQLRRDHGGRGRGPGLSYADISQSMSRAEYPAATSAAVIAPADVPATRTNQMKLSSSNRRAPENAAPRAPPPSKTPSTRGNRFVNRSGRVRSPRSGRVRSPGSTTMPNVGTTFSG